MKGTNINTSNAIYKYPLDQNGNPILNYESATVNSTGQLNSVMIGDKCIMKDGEVLGLSIPLGAKQSGFMGSPISIGVIYSIIQIKKINSISDTKKYVEYFTLYTNK